jgi:hypothetical protein
MEDHDNQEQAQFDRNYDNTFQRVVDAYAKRGAPDENAHELDLQLDALASAHVLRMVNRLILLHRNRAADLELDVQAADRVTKMFEQLILLRRDPPCSSRH